MRLKVGKSKSRDKAIIKIPGSKSHTIRALFIAGLAKGESRIFNPLISEDIFSAVKVCESFGALINNNDAENVENDVITVQGFAGRPPIPKDVLNVGNSGTTLRLGLSVAALVEGYTVFTGDSQIRQRGLTPLINSINELGGKAFSTRENGMAPVVVKGRMEGGKTNIDAYSSQFLSSLLLCCPLLEKDTEIQVTQLNEVPYVEMTLWWLRKQDINYENDNFERIYINGGQQYKGFNSIITGDFSSATFFMVLGAISGNEIELKNLDMDDPQGDKLVLSVLENMGAKVLFGENLIKIKGGELTGMEVDMNSIPDALPAMAVAGCFAKGETRLVNVPQARLKETDRISVICKELKKMGADIEELPDGLIIKESKLTGCEVDGHYDHRIVMALAIAGLCAEGNTIISTSEAVDITFPEFVSILDECGYDIAVVDN